MPGHILHGCMAYDLCSAWHMTLHPLPSLPSQYRYGTGTMEALRTLWSQGGIPRFYQGLAPALIQVGP